MTLSEKIQKDLVVAMKSKDELRLSVLRGIKSAIQYKETEKIRTIDENESIQLLQTLVKQRKESITQFESGGRADLVAKEQAELVVLQAYLPAQMSEAEIDALIAEAVAATGASSIKDMGKVMGIVKAKAQGKADMGAVSARIKQKLS